MRRRGLLRAVHRHPVARTGAALALVVYFLVGLSPLWVADLADGGLEVCTAYGLQVIPSGDLASRSSTDKAKAKGDCPLCRIQATFLLLPPDGSLVATRGFASMRWRRVPAGIATGLFAGFDHHSRAPPAQA